MKSFGGKTSRGRKSDGNMEFMPLPKRRINVTEKGTERRAGTGTRSGGVREVCAEKNGYAELVFVCSCF